MSDKALADITKEDFQAYEDVRQSGILNMYDSQVQTIADITHETHLAILNHYDELNKKWPEVRDP